MHDLQTSSIAIHSRLAIETEPAENKDEEITGMKLSIDTVSTTTDIPTCMSVNNIQEVTQNDTHLQDLKGYTIRGWLSNRNDIKQKPYSMLRDE